MFVEICINLFTYFSKTYDYLYDILNTTKQGIYDAHTPGKWIFTTANTYPCFANDSWNVYETPRVYYPATNKFYTHSSSKITLDIVIANISGPIEHDISSFLYKTSWSSDHPPSLYELVLVYLATEKIFVPYELLDTCTLSVVTSDADIIDIKLGSCKAKRPFRTWDILGEGATGDDLKID